MTLLEIIVALAILAMSAAALTGLFAQGVEALDKAERLASEIARAATEMDRIQAWSYRELASRPRRSPAGEFILVVDQLAPTLFDVTLLDARGRQVVLSTSLYRSEGRRHEVP